MASIWRNNILRQFFLQHNLFLKAHGFPPVTLSENCSFLGTDNVPGQLSQHIFAPNGGYCLFIIIIYFTCIMMSTGTDALIDFHKL